MMKSDSEVSKLGLEALPVESALPKDVPIEEKAIIPPPPPPVIAPDGGTRAWLQVLGCWLVFFNVWYVLSNVLHMALANNTTLYRGTTFAFGMFQSYYELVLLPNKSSSTISWIGTVATYLLIVVGVISGPLFDLGHYRTMLFGGAALSSFGLMMLSLATEYYQIMLAQGICLGLGTGILYVPGIALVSRSFSRRRAIALGIVTCGAPFGKTLRGTSSNHADCWRHRRYSVHHHLRSTNRFSRIRLDCQDHGIHHDSIIPNCISPVAMGSWQYRRH
jgi:hypothetical protein